MSSKKPTKLPPLHSQTVIEWMAELLKNWETLTYVQVRGKTILLKDAEEQTQARFVHDRLREFREKLRVEALGEGPTAEDLAEAADADG